MHEHTKKALELIDRAIREETEAAYDVAYSEFPDMDEGPDEEYEAQINEEYNRVLDEIAAVLTSRYGSPIDTSFPWANLRASGWRIGTGVVYAFLERDDWDTPLSIVVGRANATSLDTETDPWEYERKEA